MSRAKRLAEVIHASLKEALPGLRKTILNKLPLAVSAMLEARTPNTQELIVSLPLDTERADMREQWLRRLLENPLVDGAAILEPFAKQALARAAQGGQTIQLLMDQTDLGDHAALLMLSLSVGSRALPLLWRVQAGPANLGWEDQYALLSAVQAWLPEGASVMLLADRFYPSVKLLRWVQEANWRYRLRLKGNITVDVGQPEIATTGDLAAGVTSRFEPHAHLFAEAIPTAIGVLHEKGHPEPWIIAMDGTPNRAAVLDYGARWGIEPQFSDFKSRGFCLEDTHLRDPQRISCMVLIMALAMYWCVQTGRDDALRHPTPTEKKPVKTPEPIISASERPPGAPFLGSRAAYAYS